MTHYEIRAGKNAPCELISVTELAGYGDVKKLICEGTHTYCKRVMVEIESRS